MFDAEFDWQPHRLDELLTVKRGASPRPIQDPRWFSESGYGWVRIGDVTRSDRVLTKTTQYLSDEGRQASVEIAPGDLIMSICATIGRPLISGIHACIHDGFVVFRDIPKDRLDREYLYYFLQEKTEYFDSLGQPGTQKNLNSKLVGATELSLPPLDEQRRIAETLRSLDEVISGNRNALKQIERSRSAFLHAAFEETDWHPIPLGELGRWQSGSTPSKGIAENWGGGVPWICPRDMKMPVISKTSDTISKVALGGSCRLVPVGTLMLVVRGMILARAIPTAITAVEATYNQDMKAFIPNGRASARFVQMCIQHQEARLLQMVNTATHGTKKLDTETIESISIPLPAPEQQNTLVATVSRLDEATVYYGTEHLRLSELRRGLRADLISGRVRVPA